MADPEERLDQTRLALAALAACIAHTLGESKEAALPRFERALELAQYKLREGPDSNLGALETLTWTREILKSLRSQMP